MRKTARPIIGAKYTGLPIIRRIAAAGIETTTINFKAKIQYVTDVIVRPIFSYFLSSFILSFQGLP